MVNIGYVEDGSYRKAAEAQIGYFCSTCEYFTTNFNSLTGYQCTKYLFPDRPYACCDGWEKKE